MKRTIAICGLLAAFAALPAASLAACKDCGVVTEVKTVKKEGEGSGLGAVAGGVVGGVLGHQIGSGRGNTAATVVGAGAGAYAGHQIEKNQKTVVNYQVLVKMDNGKTRTFAFKNPPDYRAGDKVKVVEGMKLRHR